MALSGQEIKRLTERVNSCLDGSHGSNDLLYLKEALQCLDKIIANVSPSDYFFERRGETKYRLSVRSGGWLSFAQGAIQDMTRAIELNPDKAYYYQRRGQFHFDFMKHRKEQGARRKESIEKVRVDFRTALSKNPTLSRVWLEIIAINILVDDWDEAISVYGQSGPYIKDNCDKPVRAWLGCIALVLAGDAVGEDDRKPLQDTRVSVGYNFIEDVMLYVAVSLRDKLSEKKLSEVNTLNELLADHLDDPIDKSRIYNALGFYYMALNTLDKALDLNPAWPLAWNNKGYYLQNQGRFDEALQAYSKALELAPDYSLALQNKRILLGELKCSDKKQGLLARVKDLFQGGRH